MQLADDDDDDDDYSSSLTIITMRKNGDQLALEQRTREKSNDEVL